MTKSLLAVALAVASSTLIGFGAFSLDLFNQPVNLKLRGGSHVAGVIDVDSPDAA
jgi:hypothetical protein